MQKNNLRYIYRGRFTQKISDSIITIAEQDINASHESPQTRKRVFAILVECLQNILRHQLTPETHELLPMMDYSGFFAIQKKDNFYQITSGNVIETTKVTALQDLLTQINSLDKKELKQFYLKLLNNNEVNEKGGAGLGLIDIARKAHSELLYEFHPIDDLLTFFYLHTTIPQHEHTSASDEFDFEMIQDIHRIVNEQNIVLVYSGMLNQENLISLLSITNGLHYGEYDIKKKIFNIMVEMLQNIVKHGSKQNENDSGNPAIFYLFEIENAFVLNCGNYIQNTSIEKLTHSIDYVNNLNNEQLNEFYITQLLNFEIDTHKESGLGIIDLCIKSNNKLAYCISPINNTTSFFSMQVKVSINSKI
jgi:ribosomal 30S subunit maturation factor RimM